MTTSKLTAFVGIWAVLAALSAVSLLAGAATGAIEWTARQWLGQNVRIDWLEWAGLFGFLSVACAMPFVLTNITSQRPGTALTAHWQSKTVLTAAILVTANLVAYVLLVETGKGRIFFLSGLTLTAPAIVLCAAAWLLVMRGVSLVRREPTSVYSPADRTVVVSSIAIAIAILLALALAPANQPAYSLLGQVAWNVLSDQDFLTLLMIGCAIELACTDSLGGILGQTSTARSSTSGAQVGGELAGLIMPFGRLAMVAALLLGLRGADAMATLLVPATVIGSLAFVFGRPSLSFSSALVVGLLAATGVTLLGWARPVEAFAVVCVVFACLTLIFGKRQEDLRSVSTRLTGHIGSVGLYVLSGAYLYLISGVIGVQQAVATGVEFTGLGLIPLATILLIIAILLCRWLAPLEILLVLLPFVPVALHTAGASLRQSYVLICISIALATTAYRFVTSKERRLERRSFFLMTVSLLVFYAVMVFPDLVEILPVRSRFW